MRSGQGLDKACFYPDGPMDKYHMWICAFILKPAVADFRVRIV